MYLQYWPSGIFAPLLPCPMLDLRGTSPMMNQERYAVGVRILYLGLLAVLALGAVSSGFAQVSSAASQSQVGPSQRVQLEGELEIIHQDFKDGHGRFVYSLKLADGTRVPL